MMLPPLLAAVSCTPRSHATAPLDPISAVAVSPLPIGSLGGAKALVLVVGGVVFGDSALALETQRTAILEQADAALDTALRRDAHDVRWEGLPEQRDVTRRNPALDIDPDRLPTAYLVSMRIDQVPDPLWSDIRTLAAMTDARYAIVPAAVRIAGAPGAFRASYVLVAVDARTGAVVWRGRSDGASAATPAAALALAASAAVPNPLQAH